VCAGDLSTQGHSAEFEKAGAFLERVANELDVPPDLRFLVAGDHDVDWPLTRLAAERDPWYGALRQRKFEEVLKAFAPSFAFCSGGLPLRLALRHDVHLFLLDSPWDDRSTTPPHHGRLGQAQLSALRRLLREPAPTSTKLVLLHHALSARAGDADPEGGASQVGDAEELLDLLRTEGVSFVVHGHQHRFGFQQVTTPGPPMSILCSGSTTARYEELPKQVPNAFHVINFDSLAPDRTRGHIHTRVFSLADGWVPPDRTRHRLGSRVPFGHSASTSEVDRWIGDLLTACDARKVIRMDAFLSDQPDGKYHDPDEFKDQVAHALAARGIADSYGIRFNRDHECWQLEVVECPEAPQR
jgi:hypothetical protein